MRAFLLLAVLGPTPTTIAQSLSPKVIGTTGASAASGSVKLEWTVGEIAVTALAAGGTMLTQGFHQAGPVRLRLSMRAFLSGPYSTATGRMNDDLRANGWLPLAEPYTALGFTLVGGGGEAIAPAVLTVTGSDAIIDWVLIELREAGNNSSVLYSRCALVQADGDVVEVDGASPVALSMPPGNYHIALHHRNHLAVLTLNAVALSHAPLAFDLTVPGTPVYGTNAQQTLSGVRMLWCGDVTANRVVKYVGDGNDRDPILLAIGGNVPTATIAGYLPTDVTMDGIVKYVGAGNDRDPILVNIGGSVPTATRAAQLP